MAEQPARSVDFDALRDKYNEQRVQEPQRFESKLEQDRSEPYPIPITPKGGPTIKLHFRAFTHGEILILTRLPFYARITDKHRLEKEPLTEQERAVYDVAREQMLDLVVVEKNAWIQIIEKDSSVIKTTFNIMMYLSAPDEEFSKEMDAFLASDYGRMYGFVWIERLGKMPSEVGKVSEFDYQFVERWITTWLQFASKKGVPK